MSEFTKYEPVGAGAMKRSITGLWYERRVVDERITALTAENFAQKEGEYMKKVARVDCIGNCGAKGPKHPINGEHAGWMCHDCLKALGKRKGNL